MDNNEAKKISWRKVVFRGMLWFLGASVLFFVVYVFFSLTGRPAITVDYVAELNRISVPEGVDESMNASPYYEKAAEMLGELPEEMSELFFKMYLGELTEEEKRKIEDYITEKSEVFEQVKKGTEKDYYWAVYETEPFDNSFGGIIWSDARQYRTIARLLCIRSRKRVEEGDFEGALDDIAVCMKLGFHLKQRKGFSGQLAGVAIQGLAIEALKSIVDNEQIETELLVKVQGKIEQIYLQDDFVLDFDYERLAGYDEIQRCFSADGIFGGKFCRAGVRRISYERSLRRATNNFIYSRRKF